MNNELLIKEKKSKYQIKEDRKTLITIIIINIIIIIFEIGLLTTWLEEYNIGMLIGLIIVAIILIILDFIFYIAKKEDKQQELKYILINENGIKFNYKMLTKNGTQERKNGEKFIEWDKFKALIDLSNNKTYTVDNNKIVKKELDYKDMTDYKIIPNIYNPDEGSYDEINNSIIFVTKDDKYLRIEELFIEQSKEEDYDSNIEITINLWQNSFKNQ